MHDHPFYFKSTRCTVVLAALLVAALVTKVATAPKAATLSEAVKDYYPSAEALVFGDSEAVPLESMESTTLKGAAFGFRRRSSRCDRTASICNSDGQVIGVLKYSESGDVTIVDRCYTVTSGHLQY